MTKKIIYAMILVLSALLITGCSGGGNNEPVITDNPYLGGSQGLLANFDPLGVASEGATQSIFDDETFHVTINLKNKGEYAVESGKIKTVLKGISPSDYTGLAFEKTNSESAEKISEFNQKGGEVIIDHGNGRLVESRIKDRNMLNANIFADVIYPYKTFISAPKVCFRDDSMKTKDTICEIENPSLQVFSSGAPIRAISAKETRTGVGLVGVEFTVENAGSGESKDPAKLDFDYRYNEIAFKVQESSTPQNWDCKSSGRAGVGRFGEDNKLTILCKLITPVSKGQEYQSQLDLTLEYDYKTIISTDLIIKNKNT